MPPPPKKAPLTGSQCGKSRCPHGSHSHHPGRGGKTDPIDVGEDHNPLDEIVLYGIQVNVTTISTTCTDVNIREIIRHSTQAFTKVTLPVPSGKKCQEANIQVKVDTGAGGNVLPLWLFCQIYPEWVNSTETPTGL